MDSKVQTPPQVGIIILNYNGWPDTLRCLDSLARLDYPRHAIVLVDNASTDDSLAKIRQAQPDLEVLANRANLGFAEGNNVAIRLFLERNVDFIWLLNNDTTVDPQALSALVALAESNPALGAVGSVIYSMEQPAAIQAYGGGAVSMWTGRTRDARNAQDKLDYITGASVLLRSQALRQVGLPDSRYFFQWEDTDMALRMGKTGWQIAVAKDSKIWHRGGGTEPGLSPLRVEHHAFGLVLFLRKNAPIPLLSTLPIFAYYARESWRQRSWAPLRAGWRGWRRGWSA